MLASEGPSYRPFDAITRSFVYGLQLRIRRLLSFVNLRRGGRQEAPEVNFTDNFAPSRTVYPSTLDVVRHSQIKRFAIVAEGLSERHALLSRRPWYLRRVHLTFKDMSFLTRRISSYLEPCCSFLLLLYQELRSVPARSQRTLTGPSLFSAYAKIPSPTIVASHINQLRLFTLTVQDVADTVECASQTCVKAVARSGGHSYATDGVGGQDGSFVDLEKHQ